MRVIGPDVPGIKPGTFYRVKRWKREALAMEPKYTIVDNGEEVGLMDWEAEVVRWDTRKCKACLSAWQDKSPLLACPNCGSEDTEVQEVMLGPPSD